MDLTDSWKTRDNSCSSSLWTNCTGPSRTRDAAHFCSGTSSFADLQSLEISHRCVPEALWVTKQVKWCSGSCTDLSPLMIKFILWDPQAKQDLSGITIWLGKELEEYRLMAWYSHHSINFPYFEKWQPARWKDTKWETTQRGDILSVRWCVARDFAEVSWEAYCQKRKSQTRVCSETEELSQIER